MPGLDGADVEVVDDTAHLGDDHRRFDVLYRGDADRVLCVTAVRAVVACTSKAQNVRRSALNTGPAAESDPRWKNGEGLHLNNLNESPRWLSTLGTWEISFKLAHSVLRPTRRRDRGFRSMEVLGASLVASEASIATVALRRVDRTSRVRFRPARSIELFVAAQYGRLLQCRRAVKVAELAARPRHQRRQTRGDRR